MTPKRSILLIHPPVAKPCEPPAGVARLAAALQSAEIPCRVFDASLTGILDLLEHPFETTDTWTRRASRKRELHLTALRGPNLYTHRDRYRQVVADINRLLQAAGEARVTRKGSRLGLANYGDPDLMPVRSADLLRAAENYRDNPFYLSFNARLIPILENFSPDIVGLSVNFMSQALCAFAMAGWLRQLASRVHIVMGGGLVTSWRQIPGLGNPFNGLVDDLIVGPGEQTLLELCAPGHTPEPPSEFTPKALPAGEKTLLDLCAPAHSLERPSQFAPQALPLDDYLAPVRVLPYSTAGGCWWRKCAFCPEKAEGQPYRPLPWDFLQKDLHRLGEEMRPGLIHFLDNALAPRFLTQLMDRPPGAPWYGFARISPHLADPDVVRGLKKSGCVMLKLGIESGDQAVLDALHKGTRVEMVSQVLNTLKAAGIKVYAYLLFGTPAETEAAARRTLDWTLAHSEAIDFLNLAVFNLPAYSPEAKSLKTQSFYPGDLSLYADFEHPHGWQRHQVRRFLDSVFKKSAPIRKILVKDPPHFTSNHAPFLVMNHESKS